MLKFVNLILIVLISTIPIAQAKIYIRDYTYKASEIDSKVTSRTNALDQVKLILLQEIGTHIRQKINITKDGAGNTFASEDVEAITAGLTKVDIIEEKWNGETYYLKAKINADTDSVLQALEDMKNDNSKDNQKLLNQLKEIQNQLQASRNETAKLRNQLTRANKIEKEQIIVRYTKQIEEISFADMTLKGHNSELIHQYKDAFYWYTKASQHDYTPAQFKLANMYHLGHGVSQSNDSALFWLEKSAQGGYANAQNILGTLYEHGEIVAEDYKVALHWYKKAAQQNYTYAQTNIGYLYEEGLGVEQNYETAAIWYQKAIDNGDEDAKIDLESLYEFIDSLKE